MRPGLFAVWLGFLGSGAVAQDSDYRLEREQAWTEVDYRHQGEVIAPGFLRVHSKRNDPSSAIVEIRGQIPFGSLAQEFYSAIQGRSEVVVVIDSIGGNAMQASMVALQIRRASRRTRFRAYIPNGATCDSAATWILFAASSARVHPTSSVSVHASSCLYDCISPEEELQNWIAAGLPERLANRYFADGIFHDNRRVRRIAPHEFEHFDHVRVDEDRAVEDALRGCSSALNRGI